jgi:uncharacterized membrane protein YcaP (DUF421 family)
MDGVIRAIIVYFALVVIFRIAGKRTLAEITTFDFVLLLIIGDIVQPALMDNDNSLMACLLVIVTIIGIDLLMAYLKHKSKTIEKLMDGVPLVVVEDGKMIKEHADKVRVDEADVMQEARRHHGLERLDQIKFAILEVSGGITVIPKEAAKS